MNLRPTRRPRSDLLYAYAATVVFMMAWFFSPLGNFVFGLAARVHPMLVVWSWPIAGLTFFWLTRLFLHLRRKRPARTDHSSS
jgi:hypothetical protein